MHIWKTILSAAVAIPLSAQEPSTEDLKDLQAFLDQPVQTASKRVQRLKEAAADMTVLKGHDLMDLGYQTLGDALGGVLGFRTNEDRTYQGLGARGLYVLGDQNTRVLILLDGHALNSAAEVGSSKVGADFGIPLTQVDRVEIVRGPASSLYGNSAFLGMVNVVTKGPAQERFSGEAAVTGDTRSLAQGDAMISGRQGSVGWRFLFSSLGRGGSRVRFPELSSQTLPAELDQEERQSAYLNLTGGQWNLAGYVMERTQRASSAPFQSTIGSPVNRDRNRQAYFDGRYTPSFGAIETLFRVFGDRSEYGCDLDYDGTRGAGSGPYTESDPNWSLGGEGQARVKAGDSLLFTLGWEESQQHYHGVADSSGTIIETKVRHRVQNTYIQGEWRPTDSLGFTLGLQQASWIVTRAQTLIDGVSTPYPTPTLRGITPRFAAVWQPSSLDIFKLLYGGGYRNPTIFERYYSDDGSILANPSLEPERIRTLSGVWVHLWGGGIQSQVSLNDSQWRRLIQPVVLEEGVQQSQNSPRTLHGSSLEAELQGRWPGWSFYSSLGLYRWEQEHQTFPNTARIQAGFRLTRHWKHWNASGEIRYVGPRENPELATRVPGSAVCRASLGWEQDHWWVRATLEDIGNAQRQDLVASDYAPITHMASDGRTFRLSAGLRF
ncbi:MAG: hypothetical protein H6Q00_2955 [Holophagaceae bacterium]|nr:hypothetical protein [Holophagaceae bacterium]